MGKFLQSVFEPNDVNNPTPRALSNVATNGISSAYGGSSTMGKWDIDHAITHGYEKVIWVFRCIDAIASNASGIPVIVRAYDDVDGSIQRDPVIHRLFNRRPNAYETSQQFRYRLITQLMLSRKGVFIEVVHNNIGRPHELHILPPSSVEPIRDPNTYVSGYRVKSATQGSVILPPNRVIWVRNKPHPTDPYAQMTPLVSAGLAADTDFLARIYNRNFLANDGRPATLINVRGQLSDENIDEMKRRFSGGVMSAGSTTVMESDGVDVQDMSASPRDAMYVEALAGSKADLLLAFGVPESVLGNASGRTFDNADAEGETFWTVTMMPLLDAVASSWDGLTIGGLYDNLLVAHDYTKVDVLQRRAQERAEQAKGEVLAGLMTIDQYLVKVGRTPFNVAGTQVLWVTPGAIPVGMTQQITQEAQDLLPVGIGAQPPQEDNGFDDGSGNYNSAPQQVASQQVSGNPAQQARALSIVGKALMPPLVMTPQQRGRAKVLKSRNRANRQSSLRSYHTPTS